MEKRFEGKVALITGAGQGIGYQIAKSLAQEGAYVVINDLNPEIATCAADKINRMNKGACLSVPGDAGKIPIIKNMVQLANREFGKVDLAIANAGHTLFGDFYQYSEDDFDKVMEVNVKGAFFLTQEVAKLMRSQPNGGRILLMSSTIGLLAYPNLAAYSMTKAALQMMAKSLVLDLAPYDISINAISPGATLTERTSREEPDYEHYWSQLIPRKKVARPIDIANAALFLVSEEAAHITGQTLVVDGGWSSIGHNLNGSK
jgi:glucose 1-dehydrogenase